MRKKWNIRSAVTDHAGSIATLPASVLRARGIDEGDFKRYLDSSVSRLEDPLLLRDMDRAVRRIERALQSGERIVVYGDYDVDGITSVCILTDYLQKRGANCGWYIPDRAGEGYGVNAQALDHIKSEGAVLVITVDTGITAVMETEYARSLGMDLVITDHHECRETLPKACAVVNPHRPDCPSGFKQLAGVGVVYKLLCALEHGDAETVLDRYGDLVAIGTVADVMPVTGENRAIIVRGLEMLSNTRRSGIQALLRLAGAESRPVSAATIGYTLAPRLNAAGRMDRASCAAELLMENDSHRAEEMAKTICDHNAARQKTENGIMESAEDLLLRQPDAATDNIIVLWNSGWHSGIIGIVASRLCERFYRPVILLTVEGDIAKGSGRSIPGFNLFEALHTCSELLDQYGGHELAAGLSLRTERLPELRAHLNEYAHRIMTPEMLTPVLDIDCSVGTEYITMESVRSLSLLEPCGTGNPQPLFCLRGAVLSEVRAVGQNGSHLKLRLDKDGRSFGAIYFGMSRADFSYDPGDCVDVVCSLDINSFRGNDSVQLTVRDVRTFGISEEKIAEGTGLFLRLAGKEAVNARDAKAMLPAREDFIALWRVISRCGGGPDAHAVSAEALLGKLSGAGRDLSYQKLLVMLAVLEESGVLQKKMQSDGDAYCAVGREGKVDITDAPLLKKLRSHLDPPVFAASH